MNKCFALAVSLTLACIPYLASPQIALANIASGVPIVDQPTGGGIANGATFGMVGKPNHSYLCAVSVTGADYGLSLSVLSPGGSTLTGVRAGSSTEATRYLTSLAGVGGADVDARDNLVFFVAPSGAAEYGKYTLSIAVNSGTPTGLSADCIDTSIVCDFNTYLQQSNYLEATNLGPKTGRARLHLISADARETPGNNTFVFAAGLRQDIDIHTLAGPNSYGTIIFQSLDFAPSLDGWPIPNMSTYANGQLRSTVQCTMQRTSFLA